MNAPPSEKAAQRYAVAVFHVNVTGVCCCSFSLRFNRIAWNWLVDVNDVDLHAQRKQHSKDSTAEEM